MFIVTILVVVLSNLSNTSGSDGFDTKAILGPFDYAAIVNLADVNIKIWFPTPILR